MARTLRARFAAEAGISTIEALVASVLLLVGITAAFVAVDGSRTLTNTNERKTTAITRGQQQLERAKALAFADLELAAAPQSSTDPADPRYHVNATSLSYDWDHASTANAVEPLVIKPAAKASTAALAPREACDCGRYEGTVDTFVTQVATDLKRVTVAVKLDGPAPPRTAVTLSTLVSRQARRGL